MQTNSTVQLSLWTATTAEPSPPANRTDTSQAAADSVASTAPRRREMVLAIIKGRGDCGATADEICLATGWLIQSVTPRINELTRSGHVRDSGRRRKTQTGRTAIVWLATRDEQRRQQGL